MKRLFITVFLALSSLSAGAQFLVEGGDPGWVRWKKMDSPEFRIIYPEGEDSLARVYGSWLEKARIADSWSSGLLIGREYKSRMPVVLHSFNSTANASVAWAPKRMDMYTVMDPYSPTPIPWAKLLALHEGRHAAQMQAGREGRFRVLHYLTGELFAGAFAGIFPGPAFLEGDAVVAETALTESGRGRQASFLSYMMPAFDSGDFRDYWQWSLGSKKYYAPDYYRTGYLLISGTRVFFDDPSFTKEYFERTKSRGLLFNLQKTVRAASGMGFDTAFRTIEEGYRCLWAEDALSRGPFMPSRQVSPAPWRHTAYQGSAPGAGHAFWSKKSGLTSPGSIVLADTEGNTLLSKPFSRSTSDLRSDLSGARVWWSETVPHWRWSLGSRSRIRYFDTSDPRRFHDLTKDGKYFNPAPSPDGKVVSVTEYPPSGGSSIVLLDSRSGEAVSVISAPDSVQFTESAWVDGRLFAAGLSGHGMGIYEIPLSATGAEARTVIAPQPVELSSLRTMVRPGGRSSGHELTFVCDRTGVNEMYLLDVDSGVLRQVTSTRYGIHSSFFNETADTLYYSSLAPSDRPQSYLQGHMVYATAAKDLPMNVVSFTDRAAYRVADALSRQERELAGQGWEEATTYSETSFSEPRRYSKLLPVIHSWAPFYFNYDNVDNLSGDEYYEVASLGATVMFQNLTGNGYGFIGYNLHEDPWNTACSRFSSWRHSAHVKFMYSGLVPVFELSADIGDRAAADITRVQQQDENGKFLSIFTNREAGSKPYLESSLRVYVPINLSSGGFSRGIVPQMRFRYTNDRFNDRISLQEVFDDGNEKTVKEIGSLNEGGSSLLSTMDFSVRGYVVRDKAAAQVYPRTGIGAEIGFHTRPGLSSSYGNSVYFYAYGYLPGLLENQGMKLTASYGTDLGNKEFSYPDNPISFLPRGFADTNLASLGRSCAPTQFKATFDYAIPFINLDWSGLSPIAYVMNMEVTPFADISYHRFKYSGQFLINRNNVRSEVLASVGADFAFNLGNFLWLPYETRLGLRYAWNSWKEIEKFPVKNLDHHYIGAIFSVSM